MDMRCCRCVLRVKKHCRIAVLAAADTLFQPSRSQQFNQFRFAAAVAWRTRFCKVNGYKLRAGTFPNEVNTMDRSDMQVSDLLVLELQGFHDAYGSGPDFWDAYQRIMTTAAQAGGDVIALANEMAALAQGLGAVGRAQLL